MSAEEDWQRWRDARYAAATRPFGIASLARTEWPTASRAAFDGLPGSWSLDGDDIVGEDLPDGTAVRLAPGQDAEVAGVRLRNFDRRGHGLRVFDPESENRTRITEIETYDYDPAWRIQGRYRPSSDPATVDVVAVDGVVTPSTVAGEIDLATPEGDVTLTVLATASGGYTAVLGDATNNLETYRFRFLDFGDGPDGDAFVVDFNRAHLPPCAFSPEYVCPTPLPGNRWTIPVRAGERNVIRG